MGISIWKSLLFFAVIALFSLCLFPTQRELGLFYTVSKSFDQARFHLQRQFHHDPSDLMNTRRYLEVLLYDGAYSHFLKVGNKMIDRYPDDVGLNAIMADYHESRLDRKTAAPFRAIQVAANPANEEMHENLISYYILFNEQEKVIEYYESLLEREKTYENFETLARYYALQKDTERLEPHYLQWIQYYSSDLEIKIRLTELYEFLGDREKADAMYQMLTNALPESIDESRLLIHRLYSFKQEVYLIDWLEQLTKRFPSDKEFNRMLMDFYLETKAIEKAVVFFEKLIKVLPFPWNYYKALGELYFQDGNYEKAREYYEIYHEKTDGDYHSHHVYGDILAKLGDADGSRREYETALRKIRWLD